MAGGHQIVHFDLSPRDLSSVTDAGDRIVAPGKYVVSVGGGQPGTSVHGSTANVVVAGSVKLPE